MLLTATSMRQNQSIVDFRSDNCGRAAPELIEALTAANTGSALGYGGDALTAALQTRLAEVFEAPVRVFPVPTGTAANAVALAASSTPFGAVYCSSEAHINTSECNAQVGEKISQILVIKYISERRHHLAAIDDLPAHLGFFQPSAHAGEVGALVAAGIPDSVTVHATAFGENRCAARPLAA